MKRQNQQRESQAGDRKTNHYLVWTAVVAFGLGFWINGQVQSKEFLASYFSIISPESVGTETIHNDDESALFCPRNPYIPFIAMNHSKLQLYGSNGLDAYALQATTDPAKDHNHKRFRVFEELAQCQDEVCIGGSCRSDTSKIMCGLSILNNMAGGNSSDSDGTIGPAHANPTCVVYSIGGNNQWEFEVDILERTSCEVHTFDCTGNIERFKVPTNDSRLHFHYECLHGGVGDVPGPNFLTLSEMAHKYGHTQIDLLKMDIEGFEWGVFDGFSHHHQHEQEEGNRPKADGSFMELVLPMQILVEVHYKTHFKELFHDRRADWKFEEDMISLARQLFQMGYIVIKHDDNRACKHCVELTLVRAYCKQS